MSETTMMMDLVNAQQANQKLLRIIENLKPTDLRDQFAMAAPHQEIIEYLPSTIGDVCRYVGVEFNGAESYTNEVKLKAFAKARYEYADAMLNARGE